MSTTALPYITDALRDFLLTLFPKDRPGVFVANIGLGGERETDSITVYFHGEALKGQAHFIENDKPAGMVNGMQSIPCFASGKIEVEVRYLSPTGENVIGEVYDAAIEHDKEVCPYCNKADCYFGCDQSQHDDTLEHEEEVEARRVRNGDKLPHGGKFA